MKRTVIAGLAIAALATTAVTATAMPVRDLRTETYGNTVEVSAVGISPPAGSCGAYYGIRILGPSGSVLRSRFGRFNACQEWGEGDSLWSAGIFRASFGVRSLPEGMYTVCAGAAVSAGRVGGTHAICRLRRI